MDLDPRGKTEIVAIFTHNGLKLLSPHLFWSKTYARTLSHDRSKGKFRED